MVRDTLDTNLLVHYILGDNPKQAAKVRALLDEPGCVHHLPMIVVAEAVHVFLKHYEREREEIAFSLNYFFEQFGDVLEYDKEIYDLAIPFFVEHPALSFEDCCLGFYAEVSSSEPLWTFDKNLAKQHASAKVL